MFVSAVGYMVNVWKGVWIILASLTSFNRHVHHINTQPQTHAAQDSSPRLTPRNTTFISIYHSLLCDESWGWDKSLFVMGFGVKKIADVNIDDRLVPSAAFIMICSWYGHLCLEFQYEDRYENISKSSNFQDSYDNSIQINTSYLSNVIPNDHIMHLNLTHDHHSIQNTSNNQNIHYPSLTYIGGHGVSFTLLGIIIGVLCLRVCVWTRLWGGVNKCCFCVRMCDMTRQSESRRKNSSSPYISFESCHLGSPRFVVKVVYDWFVLFCVKWPRWPKGRDKDRFVMWSRRQKDKETDIDNLH